PCASTALSPLSLHDALPICWDHCSLTRQNRHLIEREAASRMSTALICLAAVQIGPTALGNPELSLDRFGAVAEDRHYVEVASQQDRKSTRLNSSHVSISYDG